MNGVLAAFLSGLITGFILTGVLLAGNPWAICTEAKAKDVELFSCEKVKLP